MNLIVLHGPPASGKLSIANELEKIIGSKTYHNHLAIDVVKPFFDFGTKEFIELVDDIRFKCLKTLLNSYNGTVIFTWCYSDPHDLSFYENLENEAANSGANIVPVFLSCSNEELEKRVVNISRKQIGKLNTVSGLQECVQRWNLVAIPRDNCIYLNTNDKTPIESAKELVKKLKSDNKLTLLDALGATA